MSDQYELAKSEQPQDLQKEIVYESKQWNFINDINSGVYQNSQLSLVQFDLTSIYNSGSFIDIPQIYLAIPLLYTAAFSNGVQPIAPTPNGGNEWLVTPKCGSWNLIQSLEVAVQGSSVIQQQPNINFHANFKMLSQLSKDDLDTIGRTLGIYPDDVFSYFYNGTESSLANGVGPVGGNGLCNNMIFPTTNGGAEGVANYDQQSQWNTYGTAGLVYNKGLQYRSERIAMNTATPANGMNQLMSTTNMNNEFLPYFAIANTYYMTWYDVAIIRLCDICDFFAQCPLTKNFDGLLRIYFNTGVMNVNLSKATDGGMFLTGSQSTFTNTCPFTINQMPDGEIPANTTNLVVSCNIARSSVSTAYAGVVLSNSGVSHPMNACRCYYPQIKLKPSVALKYISDNRAKRIIFTNVLSNTFQNISSGATFSQLIQSGVRNIKGVLIIPFIAQAIHGLLNTGGFQCNVQPFSPCVSPFDTAPLTTPLSLTQLNIAVGGVNQLMNFYSYTYENFLQQVNLYENINSNDLGLSCKLISQFAWEKGMRYYYIDCSRATDADRTHQETSR
jgi:hypothetical protein